MQKCTVSCSTGGLTSDTCHHLLLLPLSVNGTDEVGCNMVKGNDQVYVAAMLSELNYFLTHIL